MQKKTLFSCQIEKKSVNLHLEMTKSQKLRVMAIINVTPDSFVASTRNTTEEAVLSRVAQALEEGATMLDIGGQSTRPGFVETSLEEEWRRVEMGLTVAKRLLAERPTGAERIELSVDTYRAEIARRAAENGATIINDVTAMSDPEMMDAVAQAHIPYIYTYTRGGESLLSDVAFDLDRLHRAGVADVIIDPGFGFGKTFEQNWQVMRSLHTLRHLGCPILAGVSRKSMLQKAVGCTAEQALNVTTAAHMVALEQGASILRVHDVKAAAEAIRIFELANLSNENDYAGN